MYAYLSRFESNTFPIPEWGVVVVWLILFLASHLVVLRVLQAFRAQECIHVGPPAGLLRPISARLILTQLAFAAAIFTLARLIGGAFFVFFAGGYVLTTAVMLATNLYSWRFYRDLKPPLSVGTITLSNRFVVRSQSYGLWSAAALCLCVGLLIAHLAFLGAAYFLGCDGLGFLLKSKAKRPAQGDLVTPDSQPRGIGTGVE